MRKLWYLLSLLIVACGGGEEVAAPKAERIVCTAAYRTSVEKGIEREETLSFGDSSEEQSIAFTDMVFHAAYRTGEADNERSLRLWVTIGNETAAQNQADAHTSISQLFQLQQSGGPQNQFQGGHGFTGLTYSYHPETSAEMQYWCSAEAR